ncbi:hypothetical protein T484DRAFT_1815029 [Baffinella frigidus]|nr:hypothetical protein T484DRAFT_1815029 [Cryptophyta sp. CCMP2293]
MSCVLRLSPRCKVVLVCVHTVVYAATLLMTGVRDWDLAFGLLWVSGASAASVVLCRERLQAAKLRFTLTR